MTLSPIVLILLVLLCIGVGAAIGYLYAVAHGRGSVDRDNARLGQLQAEASAAGARAARLEQENNGLIERARQDNNVMRSLAPLGQQLEALDQKVQRLGKVNAAQGAELREQLSTAARTQQELARETSTLRTALTSTSTRGTWGEVELRRIVEAAGMLQHVDFSTQLSTGKLSINGSASRPDMLIHLPGGGHLAIDAKVPLNSLMRAQAIEGSDHVSETQRAGLMADHAKALRGHVNALIKRNYPADFPASPQLTVMFLPAESLLSEALSSDPTLLEDALRAGISPTSPSSLLALLRSVAAVWATTQITQESQDIMNLGRTLVQRLGVVAGHLDSLGNSLRSSVKNYNKTVASLESRVLVTAREFESLESNVPAPKPVTSDDAQVRSLTTAELTID